MTVDSYYYMKKNKQPKTKTIISVDEHNEWRCDPHST